MGKNEEKNYFTHSLAKVYTTLFVGPRVNAAGRIEY